MMDTYLMMLYVSVEQEKAVKQYFLDNGWPYCKPDLSVLTDCIGPIVAETPISNKGVTNKRKKSTPAKTPAKKTKTTEKPTPAKPVRTPIQHSHGTRSRKAVMVAQPTVELTEVKVEKLDGEFVDNNVEDEEEENMDGPEAQNLDDLEPVTDNEKSASTSVAVSKLEDKSKKNASVASTAIKDMDKEDDDDIDDGDVEKVDDTDGSQTVTLLIEVDKALLTGDTTEDKKAEFIDIARNALKRNESDMANNDICVDLIMKENIDGTSAERKTTTKKFVLPFLKEELPRGQFQCNTCNKSYNNKGSWRRHLKSHRPGIKRCVACNQYFEKESDLMLHKEKYHDGVCLCSVCGVEFCRKSILRKHMLKNHPGYCEAQFTCTECNCVFDSEEKFSDHKNIHLGKKPYVCKQCGKCFSMNASLKSHEINHFKVKSELKCEHCEMTFKGSGALSNHKASVHENERYICHCGKIFKYRPGLIRHKQQMHSASENTEVKKVVEPVQITADASRVVQEMETLLEISEATEGYDKTMNETEGNLIADNSHVMESETGASQIIDASSQVMEVGQDMETEIQEVILEVPVDEVHNGEGITFHVYNDAVVTLATNTIETGTECVINNSVTTQ